MNKFSFFNYTALCALVLTMSTLLSCTDKENTVDPSALENQVMGFSFETSQDEDFTINLGINAKNNVVNLYGGLVTEETVNESESFLGSFFLDGQGCYSKTLQLPNHVKKVWLYLPNSPEFGILTADVTDGKVILDQQLGGLTTRAVTRSDDAVTKTDAKGNITTTSSAGSYTLYNYKDNIIVGYTEDGYVTPSDYSKDQMGNIYGVFYWEPTKGKDASGSLETHYHYGGFDDNNNLLDSNTDLSGKGSYFQNKFTELKNQNAFANVQDDIINIDIIGGNQEIEENGIIHTIVHEKVELSMSFITEAAAYCNCFGYYYYKTGEAPTTVAEGMALDKFIIFPNASIAGSPFTLGSVSAQETATNRSAYKGYSPIESGDRVKLLFKDPETGEVSTYFPAGYTVGFFLVANAYDIGWRRNGANDATGVDYDMTSHLNFGVNYNFDYPDRKKMANTYPICSNVHMNHSSLGTKLRYVSFNEKVSDEEYIIFGVEDATDFSYTDMVFTIESSDPWMTHRNRLYEWTEIESTIGLYAFEDKWPEEGDYDMNDAIIRHTRQRTIDSDNKLAAVTDYFEIVSEDNAASNVNAFSVQIPEEQIGEISYSDGVVAEPSTSSYVIFPNIKRAKKGAKASITRKFSEKTLDANSLTYNPYLIANADLNMEEDRAEIHLADHKITTLGLKYYSGTVVNSEWYTSRFISGDGRFPFAISIPLPDWNPSAPAVRIDETFAKFLPWVTSNGSKYQDWYKK